MTSAVTFFVYQIACAWVEATDTEFAYALVSQAMVIATTLSVHCFALLHCSTNQTSAECFLEYHTMWLPNISWVVWVSSTPPMGAD